LNWDERATLGPYAGTRDRIAKELEMRVIRSYVMPRPDRPFVVWDFGCGDGETLIGIAQEYDTPERPVRGDGFDTSEGMLASALRSRGCLTWSWPSFYRLDVRSEQPNSIGCDLAYTERTLINLASWDEQRQAIENIVGTLKPNGLYVMVENFIGPVMRLNAIRRDLGLPEITPPAHNLYLDEDVVGALRIPGADLVEVRRYSDVYYFLSRVVNAYQAAQRGEEPDYDSPVNRLALELPPWDEFIPHVGQGQCWVWQKRGWCP
jgi:SAM-dependent methyltransferase